MLIISRIAISWLLTVGFQDVDKQIDCRKMQESFINRNLRQSLCQMLQIVLRIPEVITSDSSRQIYNC